MRRPLAVLSALSFGWWALGGAAMPQTVVAFHWPGRTIRHAGRRRRRRGRRLAIEIRLPKER